MHALIKGAGIIGLSIGWRLLREGFSVELFDRGKAGRGASFAAAGLLGPYAEAHFEDEELIRLCEQSLSLYPQFLKELSEDSGHPITMESQGTLIVGIDRQDKIFLEQLYVEKQKKGQPALWITPQKAREIEPLLTPRITSAIWLPTEWHIDNRRLIAALIEAIRMKGGILHEEISFPEGNHPLMINASGCFADPRIRPNKGQIITLEEHPSFRLSHVVRSPRIYMAPKKEMLRIGASSEDVGFDPTIQAAKMRDLLNAAVEIVPAIQEMAFHEVLSAFRPMTEDRLPLIEENENVILAAGHGRCGILLAPYTAQTVIAILRRKYGNCF